MVRSTMQNPLFCGLCAQVLRRGGRHRAGYANDSAITNSALRRVRRGTMTMHLDTLRGPIPVVAR